MPIGRPFKGVIDEQGRECSRCGDYKLWSEFSPSTARQPGGRSSSCKSCRNAKSLETRQSDPEGYNAYRRRVTSKFGLSPEQYAWLSDQQGEKCALCFQPETKVDYRSGVVWQLSVDHDHACHPQRKGCLKCIRGLLCANCNMMLGLAEKTGGAVLLRFTDYLDQRPFLLYLGSDLPRSEGR